MAKSDRCPCRQRRKYAAPLCTALAMLLALLCGCAGNTGSADGTGWTALPDRQTTVSADDQTQLEFISDVHLSGSNDDAAGHLEIELDDISEQAPESDALCIVGDGVNTASQAQYNQLTSAFADHGLSTSKGNLFVAMGNHEVANASASGGYEALWQRFSSNWGYTSNYHDEVKGNVHLIALASDQAPSAWTCASFSATELSWLDGLLAQDEAAGRLSVVCCHQPMKDTVYETRAGQTWENGIDDADALRAVLDKYRDVLFVAGHSHLTLTAPDCIYQENDRGPIYIRDGASAYLRDSDGTGGTCQGLFVTVDDNWITIKARDFSDAAWIWTKTFYR